MTDFNKSILKRFTVLMRNNRLAHAYLFVGPENAGKSESALALAKLINCERNVKQIKEEFCGQCSSCIKINSGNHPDVLFIDAGEDLSIKIVRIRELIGKIHLKPYESEKKVFIIKDIEHLTTEGSNALLKTLEEPTQDSLLILTTSVPEKNLETVKSRCHRVHFFPMSNNRVSAQLKKDYALNTETSHFLAYFSEGCLGKARRMHETGFFSKKNEIIDNIVIQGNNDEYINTVAGNKDATKDVLSVLLSWFRDIILVKRGVEESRLVHVDRRKDLSRFESRYSFYQLKDIIQEIVHTLKLLGANLNVKIPLILLGEKIWRK